MFPVGMYVNATQEEDEDEGVDFEFRTNNFFLWLLVVLLLMAVLLVLVMLCCWGHERYKRSRQKYSVVDEATVGIVGEHCPSHLQEMEIFLDLL